MEHETRNRRENELTNFWKNQPVDRVEMSLARVRQVADAFERRVQWRNFGEYAGCAVVIACFGYYISIFQTTLIRTGCGLVMAGTLFVAFALHRRGAARTLPEELALQTCLDFHRHELERQRDLLRSVWSWYLLPFAPGLAVFEAGVLAQAMAQPNAAAHETRAITTFAIAIAGCSVVFVSIGVLNRRAASKLQREIDGLADLERAS